MSHSSIAINHLPNNSLTKGKKESYSGLKKTLMKILTLNLNLKEGLHFQQLEMSGIIALDMTAIMYFRGHHHKDEEDF